MNSVLNLRELHARSLLSGKGGLDEIDGAHRSQLRMFLFAELARVISYDASADGLLVVGTHH